MTHNIVRTEDNNEDTCTNCGQVGTFTEVCPQPREIKTKKKDS